VKGWKYLGVQRFEATFSNIVEEALVAGAVFVRACGVVYILICYFESSTLCILSKL